MHWLTTLFAHGGFKLLIILFVVARAFIKQQKGEAKRKEKELRQPTVPGLPQATPSIQNTPIGSPWSNGDAFNDLKK
jgi:hypothetical protein